jgi:hypothetical protein
VRCIPVIISIFLSRIFLFRAFPSSSGDLGLTSANACSPLEMNSSRRRRGYPTDGTAIVFVSMFNLVDRSRHSTRW